MDTGDIEFLTSSTTYRELALRCREFLSYRQAQDRELEEMAEATLFNLAVEYLVQTGMARPRAELFCNDPENLEELAMRIVSIMGPGGSASGPSPRPFSG
ncbi:MAG TPA: hypothetical protein V6D06_16150 [Trichocoleus sp.]